LTFALVAGEPESRRQLSGALFPASKQELGRLDLTGAETMSLRCGKSQVLVSYQKVNTLEYGKT